MHQNFLRAPAPPHAAAGLNIFFYCLNRPLEIVIGVFDYCMTFYRLNEKIVFFVLLKVKTILNQIMNALKCIMTSVERGVGARTRSAPF